MFDPRIPGGNESNIPPVTAAQETTPQPFYTVCKVTPPAPLTAVAGSRWMTAVGGANWGFRRRGRQYSVRARHAPRTPGAASSNVSGTAEMRRWPALVIPAAVECRSFCDGSVKFIKATIGMEPGAAWALGTEWPAASSCLLGSVLIAALPRSIPVCGSHGKAGARAKARSAPLTD